ncbi:WD40 repeat domain-containing serine/threonine protein kinase [Nocardia sp. CDC160]|uniref:WD40 repeat domain-containing serine/threonine protein kinase n=1 Tax=Nocardia sp. CDC160 TaxID=3112166 RepID=UPI002DBFDBFD|nr:serine/threonine-protein kinase [Nocardia sp. CDC160]MEC3917970.1 serine/threonine-protein kinase [Nocardia sp. CDC160]
MALQTGPVFAGFTIERLLGAGGMGVVYLARHPRLERLVALKVLGEGVAADPKARAAFDREAALAARLEHPNIVALHDRSGPADPIPWLCMQYVAGGDASTLLRNTRDGLPVEQALRLITDAAHGLDYAHGQGILHRDVKPANLLVETDVARGERALLTDFGIARTLDDTLTLSAIAATFAYAAPERFQNKRSDHRSDIYSLGCTFYHLLTGQTPFPRSDQAAVIAAHLTAPPPSPSVMRLDLPAALDDVIATALAKSPEDRYRNCAEFAAAAARVLASTETTVLSASPATGATTNPARGFGRRRLLIGATSVPMAAAVVGAAFAFESHSNNRAPDAVATTTTNAASEAGILSGHSREVTSVAFHPSGTLLASGGLDGSTLWWDVGARQAVTPIPGPSTDPNRIRSVAFSRDGNLLAVGSETYSIQLWNAHTHQSDGEPLVVDAGPTRSTFQIRSVAFSPDGTLLASAGLDKNVRLWNVAARQPDGQPLTGHTDMIETLAFSPDGALLASAGYDNTIRLWNLRTRQADGPPLTDGVVKDLLRRSTWEPLNSIAFSPDGSRLAATNADNGIWLWNLRTRQIDGDPLKGHADVIETVAFNPDGTLLASAGHDNTIRVWNLRTRQLQGSPLRGHTSAVMSVAFSPDGTLLASGSWDKTIRLWKLNRP